MSSYAGWRGQVKCPFFRREDKGKHRIVCEGISDSSRINVVFLGKERERTEHLLHYCSDDFSQCPLFHAASEKYDG